ncbi:transcriptional regulator, TetR family [Kribbella flavida DSM 17836]|uniref:Transcriptional regulator, TetR family n=1 Tax=Kribbella flavida (strain DSM 17836 / JCM 10339 / NBRC 14399) TaxID=479435 RepID=D2PR58_KRIFD|nr:TetR/AcrR family transcriptional regulator [Kribbella flavida]ADB33006.1 transcriptional regulator, TetR family [Kribbella flavida DSM 17836]
MTSGGVGERDGEILEAALRVFLRFGFRKASMDEIARAAKLSRQALYLRYAGKQNLYEATIRHLVGKVRSAALAALRREDRELTDRLADAVLALHGDTAGVGGSIMAELLQEAAGVSGPLLDELRAELVAAISEVLRDSGTAARWQDSGLTAEDLAGHLYLMSSATALAADDPAGRRQAVEVAVRIVSRAAPTHQEAT